MNFKVFKDLTPQEDVFLSLQQDISCVRLVAVDPTSGSYSLPDDLILTITARGTIKLNPMPRVPGIATVFETGCIQVEK
jgi:acetaldehyde dehydrogenase (acetylating)